MSRPRAWQLWVDTGGTFTDCLARDPEGQLHRAKVLSTGALRGTVVAPGRGRELAVREAWGAPADFVAGFELWLQGVDGAVATVEGYDPEPGRLRLDRVPAVEFAEGDPFEVRSPEPAPLLAARLVTRTPLAAALPELTLRLATTRGTNALLERRGAPVVLFVTRGFGDLLTIGDQQRPDLFALGIVRPAPLPARIVEVEERLGADGSVSEPLRLEPAGRAARELLRDGAADDLEWSAAVALAHSYRNPEHEERLAASLREVGMRHVACSSEVAPSIGLLRRAETAAVEAYLAPIIGGYVRRLLDALPGGRLLVMTSAGGLVRGERLRASESLLSGPAGGVVGAALAGRRSGFERVIAFDMGGTSTDVSRFDGDYEYAEGHAVGDVRLRAPALAIETVAAGGGSICGLDANGLAVGPASAGADPGPACYGAGGPLTLTDSNLLLGRLDPVRFQIPIVRRAAESRAEEVRTAVEARSSGSIDREELLAGFLEIADERMADAIRRISVRKGYDPADYALVAFGGAGPQHACSVARRLGIRRVVVPPDAGILSALGLGHAVIERFARRQVLAALDEVEGRLGGWFAELESQARGELAAEGVPPAESGIRRRALFLRYRGQEATLEVPYEEGGDPRRAFEAAYESIYGHRAERRAVEVESLRVIASTAGPEPDGPIAREAKRPAFLPADRPPETAAASEERAGAARVWLDGGWRQVPVHDRAELAIGAAVNGPALVFELHSSVVVEPGWICRVDGVGALVLERGEEATATASAARRSAPPPVVEELFVQRFRALVEEMGAQLRRTALSVNIRERLDFSCALLDADGRLVANAPHIPVHLGALGLCVRRVREILELRPGDVAVTNHPAAGGSHLPDVTVVTPVFDGAGKLLGCVASRAHHAEIGGSRPGSMPPAARRLVEEGVVIPPRHLVRRGRADWDGLRRLLTEAPHPSRAVEENLVDLAAQVAANHRGARLLAALAETAGAEEVRDQMAALYRRAERRMREVLNDLDDGLYRAEERLDDGTPLRVEIRVEGDGAVLNFTGSGDVHPGNLNATEAIVRSCVLYVLRVLAGEELPLNEGLMAPVRLVLPHGLLNPPFPEDPAACAAVVGGNVETSQRLVDTLLKPFDLVACSQGTMNNLVFGDESFSYYETLGGGSGAGRGLRGADAVQVHMTNTRITDVEILEHRFPVRVERFALRRGSGGTGRWPGGDGVVRELAFLRPLAVSVLTQHRVERPYGCRGGGPAAIGRQRLVRAGGKERELGPVDGCEVEPGDRLIIETPGGGGFGEPEAGS